MRTDAKRGLLTPSNEGSRESQRSGLNRRPLYSKQTATGHFLYSSKVPQGGRLSTEAAPNRPANLQRRATMAELYARFTRWFREQLWVDESELARRRLERYDARDLTPREVAELREIAGLDPVPPVLMVLRGGAR